MENRNLVKTFNLIPQYLCLDDVRSRVSGATEQRQSKGGEKQEELQENTPEADEEEGAHHDREDFLDADGLQDFQQKYEEDEGLEEITIEEIFTDGKDEL